MEPSVEVADSHAPQFPTPDFRVKVRGFEVEIGGPLERKPALPDVALVFRWVIADFYLSNCIYILPRIKQTLTIPRPASPFCLFSAGSIQVFCAETEDSKL